MYQYSESVCMCLNTKCCKENTCFLVKVISNTEASLMKYPFCSSFHASMHGVQGQFCAWHPLQALVGFSTQLLNFSKSERDSKLVCVSENLGGWVVWLSIRCLLWGLNGCIPFNFCAVFHVTNKRIQCDVFPPLFSSAAETKICHFKCFYKPLKSCNVRKYQGEDPVDLFFCVRHQVD